ncbi:hypothetical protein PAXRUDRAFT_168294, partial [Paxillus rubicundulus Ve08.2h10]
VHWMNNQTDLLVSWLTSHSADCHVLFYGNKGDLTDHAMNKPSAKDKTGIHDIIAKHIFEVDAEWTQQYTTSPKSSAHVLAITSTIKSLYLSPLEYQLTW